MPRLLLTLATLALALSAYALMLKGWRGRQRRQADLPPPPSAELDQEQRAAAVPALFVGTTDAEHWLDRIAVHHLSDRAAATVCLVDEGVVVERSGLPALLLPWGCVESAEVETALGGKVVSTGMLLVTWCWGPRRLRTALRCDDPAEHALLRDAINARLPLEARR